MSGRGAYGHGTSQFRAERLSEEAQAVWRLLRDAGGYWTASEVARRLNPGAGPREAAKAASRALGSLERGNFAVRNHQHVGAAYGVTSSCKPINGETLEPSPLAEEEGEAS